MTQRAPEHPRAQQLESPYKTISYLKMMRSLAKGELTVGQINERVPLSQSALSQHLAVLRRDGLVHTRRAAQTIHYSLAPGPAGRIIDTLYEVFCSASSL